MKKTITAGLMLLGLFQAATLGSGPYMPPRAEPTRIEDFVYRMGQAVYSGDLRIGSGQSCSRCHRGGQSLRKDSLRNISTQDGLQSQINKCVTQQDRVNGRIDNSQMQALLRFLTNRYKL